MGSLSDSFLSTLNTWLQWISVLSIGLGLIAAIGLVFVSGEAGQRQERKLADANKKITDLQPKPLKIRVRDFLSRLDSRCLAAVTNGQREFYGTFTTAQLSELQSLCAEDSAGILIKQVETGNIIIPGDGRQGGIKFVVTDELLR